MSRASQVEKAMDCEEDDLSAALAEGRIDQKQFNDQLRELQRDVRAAYEQDMEDARESVRNDWGY